MSKADGSVVIEVGANPTPAERDLEKLQKKIEAMEKTLVKSEATKTGLESSLSSAREQLSKLENEYINSVLNEADPKALKEQEATLSAQSRYVQQLEKEYSAVNKRCDSLLGKLDAAKERAGELVERILRQDEARARAAAKQMEREEKQRALAEKHAQAEERAKEEAEERARAEERANSALGKAEQYMDSFVKRAKQLAKNAFVFTLISAALRKMKEGLKSAILSNKEAADSIARLKGALLTLAAPIVNVLVPAITWLIDALTAIVSEIITIYSILSGKSVEEMKEAAEALYDEADALDKTGNSAKKAAKNLAVFDTINRLSSGASTKSISPNFDFNGNAYLSKWSGALEEINDLFRTMRAGLDIVLDDIKFSVESEAIPSARGTWETALFSLLGAVLGTAFLGFGGGVIGALLGAAIGLYIEGFNPEQANQQMGLKDEWIAVLCGLIGAVLGGAFMGPVGAGVGFLLGAILSFYISDFAEGEQISKSELVNTLMVVLCALVGAVIGATVGSFGGMVIGFGVGLVLGILINDFRAGDQGDWSGLKTRLIWLVCIIIGGIIGTVVTPGAGTLAGVIIGFAVGFILTTAIDDFQKGEDGGTTLKEAFKNVLLKLLSGVVAGIIGLVISGGNPVIALAVGLAVSFFTDSIDDSGIRKATSGKNGSSVAAVQSAPATYSVPALAQGKVIPPNREFMAILGDQKSGTNIETPLSTMVQAFKQALSEFGGGGQNEAYLVLDNEVCGKLFYRLYNAENNRVGVSLAGR